MAEITRTGERRAFEDAEVARAAGEPVGKRSRFEGDMAAYHVAEKLRLVAEAAARADPVRPSPKRVRAAERSLGIGAARVAPMVVKVDAHGVPIDDVGREVRSRRTGQAMFGGWRFEKG